MPKPTANQKHDIKAGDRPKVGSTSRSERRRPLRASTKANDPHVLALSQFRLVLIEFLKLPIDISEPALREELERTSPNVLKNYLARVQREAAILEAVDTATMRVLDRVDLTIIK